MLSLFADGYIGADVSYSDVLDSYIFHEPVVEGSVYTRDYI